RKQIDQRRLAGAVGADNRHELPLGDRHADVVERAEFPVVLGYALGFDEGGHVAASPLRLPNSPARSPAMPARPRGKKITIAARTAPSTKRQYCVIDCS